MKPSPSETIAGIRTILADTIAPELSSDHARSRLAEIRAVLAQIDWDEAGFTLVEECSSLSAALQQAAEWSSQTLPTRPDNRTFAAYQTYHEELSDVAVRVLSDLRAGLERASDARLLDAYRALLRTV